MSLSAPSPRTSSTIHADFLELSAIVEGKSSMESLVGAFQRQSISIETDEEELEAEERGAGYEDDRAREIANCALEEICAREDACCGHYPFEISTAGVITPQKTAQKTPYVFMLTLSHMGVKPANGLHPDRYFEYFCKDVAQNYISGEALKFGTPRGELPSNFRNAVKELCRRMGEGDGLHPFAPSIRQQDAKLDIVAWRAFDDRKPGKAIIFGQCAAGHDWERKTTELNPATFCSNYFVTQPPVEPLRAFFIPHCVERDKWITISRDGGILFDRCRIVSCLGERRLSGDEYKWSRHVLGILRNAAA